MEADSRYGAVVGLEQWRGYVLHRSRRSDARRLALDGSRRYAVRDSGLFDSYRPCGDRFNGPASQDDRPRLCDGVLTGSRHSRVGACSLAHSLHD